MVTIATMLDIWLGFFPTRATYITSIIRLVGIVSLYLGWIYDISDHILGEFDGDGGYRTFPFFSRGVKDDSSEHETRPRLKNTIHFK